MLHKFPPPVFSHSQFQCEILQNTSVLPLQIHSKFSAPLSLPWETDLYKSGCISGLPRPSQPSLWFLPGFTPKEPSGEMRVRLECPWLLPLSEFCKKTESLYPRSQFLSGNPLDMALFAGSANGSLLLLRHGEGSQLPHISLYFNSLQITPFEYVIYFQPEP